MTDYRLLSLLRLQCTPNVGDRIAKKLIHFYKTPEAIFNKKPDELEAIDGIGTVIIKELTDQKYLKIAESELQFIKANNINCLYYRDDNYPEHLKHCTDGPILLFTEGCIKLDNKKLISIVGTRQMTAYGAAFCRELIEHLAPLNPVIVSGFAYGIDITAHKAAIENNLQTIACIAHGLNKIYPAVHYKYTKDVKKDGGFITDFWSTSHPEPKNFLKRNRIIAGISEATIIIESAEKGGSLVTADIAASYHRELFAVPGRATDLQSAGCNQLIKLQKAHMLCSAADLIYMLGWKLNTKNEKPIKKVLSAELTEAEKQVYHFLQTNGRALLDGMALSLELPVYKLTPILLDMELKGVIKPLPGKLFELA